MRRFIAILVSIMGSLVPLARAQWDPVPSVDFSTLQLSQFNDLELEVPYYLYHFAQVANAIVETGPDKGFLNLQVNRQPVDNQPYNARIMEMQLPVAYFYTANRPWNRYYGDATVRVRLEAMLDRWTRIQNQPGSADGDYDGLFSEYSATNWSLAPTSFGVMQAAQAVDLIINSGLPFDATILENARVSIRRALMALYTRADMRAAATQYSNQFTGSYLAALLYLARWPDAELDAAFVQAVQDSAAQDQSPAGFYYERSGSDIGYSAVHENNLRITLPLLRQRADLLPVTVDSENHWAAWLSANLVPQPGSNPLLYLTNSGINTRTTHSYQNVDDRPISELVPGARPFSRSDSEYAAYLVTRRAQVQAQFGTWGPLVVPSSNSYTTGFPFDAIQTLNTWQPTPAQRTGAYNQIPYFDSDRFNRIFQDSNLSVTSARRPTYYGVFNSGTLRVAGQNFGLGLLWNERFGTALQAVSMTTYDWGTSRTGGDGSVYENAAIAVSRSINGVSYTPVNGVTTVADGPIVQTYPLGTYGMKSVTFDDSRVDVNITHTGAFSELLPLVHPSTATVTQTSNGVVITQTNGSSLTLAITGGSATINLGATAGLGYGLVRHPVTVSASGNLRYELRLSSGLPPLLPGTPNDVAVLANDTAAANPLTLTSVSFAPPEAAAAQPHGAAVIDAGTATSFPATDVQAAGAADPSLLSALPGFLVQTDWTDTRSPANSFKAKGTLTGVTNYQLRSDPAKTAIRFQFDAGTASNTSAGAVTTGATLIGSAPNSAYVGAYGAGYGGVAVTFGTYATASQNAATLGFSTTDSAGRPLAVRAAGFVLAGVNNGRSFTVEFLGIRGQRLALQTATGNNPSNPVKLYFAYDAGSNPADWIGAILIDGDNTGGASNNIGLDDLGHTAVTPVDAGSASIVNNQIRFTPSPTYFGPVRYTYTYSYPDGTANTSAAGSGEFSLSVLAPVWNNTSNAGPLEWSNGMNWSAGVAPSSVAENQPGFFTGITLPAGSITSHQDVSSSLPVNSLTLDGSAPASGAASVNLTGNALALSTIGSATPQLQLLANQSAAGTLSYNISNPVSASSDLTVSGDGSADFNLASPLSGPIALVKSGASRLTLSAANSYSGATTINAGVLRLMDPMALGTATSNINLPGGAALAAIELGGNINFLRPLTLAMHNTTGHSQLRNVSGQNTLSGALSLGGGGARWEISSLAGSLAITGNVANTVTATDTWRTLYLNGPAAGSFTGGMANGPSGNSRLNVSVISGAWVFSGPAKTYTGFTYVAGGSLRVDSALASAITAQNGGTFAGSGSTSSTLTIQTGATFSSRVTDWNSLPSAFSCAQLVGPGSSAWTVQLDATGLANFTETARTIPLVSASGGLTSVSTGSITVTSIGFPGSGTWSLATAGNTLSLVYSPTPYGSWTASVSWAGADSSPTADPDGDGLANLLEYALGGNPLGSSQSEVPKVSAASGKLAITFTRILANTDITMDVQAADSPSGPWTSIANSFNGAAFSAIVGGASATESGTGTTRSVEVRDLYQTSDPAHPCRFLRLRVIH